MIKNVLYKQMYIFVENKINDNHIELMPPLRLLFKISNIIKKKIFELLDFIKKVLSEEIIF